ncbi:FAD-dependent monooxygenase [Dolichospermum sp. FACHB-1091]|nr:FAD-dependent monooxygenase [Dolichospermum sp. FACHB-1091]
MVLNYQDKLKPEEIYDVVIVGAGPIGLATAIGLYQRGIENILVIDQTRSFRQVGQIIDLLPNGLKALKCLSVNAYTSVTQTTLSNQQNSSGNPSVWSIKNLQGQLILSIPLGFDNWFQEYGEGRVSIAWYELQTILRNLLPPERVKANHRCINVIDEPELNCVRIDCVSDISSAANPYAHWAENQNPDENSQQNLDTISPTLATTSFRAKLIIGADGINSTVRQIIYQNTPNTPFAKPEYSGFAGIYCSGITNIPEAIQTEIESRFLENSALVTIKNDQTSRNSNCHNHLRMILFFRNGQFRYIIHLPIPLESLAGKVETDLINLARQEIEKAGFPDCLQQLVNLSPSANMSQRAYYIHPVINKFNDTTIEPTWNQQRIVLIGDAAHGMPPFMAQGANQGLEDALTITRLIAKIGQNNDWDNLSIIAEAFANYEHLRRPFMEYIQSATLTELPHSSLQAWQDHNQKVYSRNFANL